MNLKELLKKIKDRLFPEEEEVEEDIDFSFELSEPETTFENGRFLNSVEQLAEEDIELSQEALGKKKQDTGPIAAIRKILLFFFAAAFLVSSGLLIKSLISKYKAIAIYDQLEEEFFGSGFNFDITEFEIVDDGAVKLLSEDKELTVLSTWAQVLKNNESGTTQTESKKEYNEELEKMRAGLTSLARINPDIYGWITVEGTNINYPLVQGEDNAYYLDHAYTGVYLPEGSIFVDYRNGSSVADNYNTVFYGHNLTTGGMFHDVTKFAKDDVMNSKLIYVYTFDGVFVYEPFAFYESRFDYNYFRTGFSDGDAFIAFANEVQNNSAVTKKNFTFTENDRLLTLSTCTNGYYTQRYALHAKLVRSITD